MNREKTEDGGGRKFNQCRVIVHISLNLFLHTFPADFILAKPRLKFEAIESNRDSVSKCCQTSHATDIPKL